MMRRPRWTQQILGIPRELQRAGFERYRQLDHRRGTRGYDGRCHREHWQDNTKPRAEYTKRDTIGRRLSYCRGCAYDILREQKSRNDGKAGTDSTPQTPA